MTIYPILVCKWFQLCLPSNSSFKILFNLAFSITYTTTTHSLFQSHTLFPKPMHTHTKVVQCISCPVFIHCNEKQGEESGGAECAAARITDPTPTQTQCLTNTGNNESNNINTLWQTTTSDLPAPPSCSSSTVIQNTRDFRLLCTLRNFSVGARSVRTVSRDP